MKKYITFLICLLTISISFSQNNSLTVDEVIVDSNGNASKFCWRVEDQVPEIIEHIIRSNDFDDMESSYKEALNTSKECKSYVVLLKEKVAVSENILIKKDLSISKYRKISIEKDKIILRMKIKSFLVPISIGSIGFGVGYIFNALR